MLNKENLDLKLTGNEYILLLIIVQHYKCLVLVENLNRLSGLFVPFCDQLQKTPKYKFYV